MAESQCVIVLTTLPESHDAAALARTLVEERLAACVAVHSVRSYYRWQERAHDDAEQQLVIKTGGDRVEGLRQRLEALHPYEVPEFLVLAVSEGSEAYVDWVRESTR